MEVVGTNAGRIGEAILFQDGGRDLLNKEEQLS